MARSDNVCGLNVRARSCTYHRENLLLNMRFQLRIIENKAQKPSSLSFQIVKKLTEGPASEYSLKLGFTKFLKHTPNS